MTAATKYKIVRFYYADSTPNKVIKRGLTLEAAEAHCRDPETSSVTAQSKTAVKHTHPAARALVRRVRRR